jgi:hypothetical protein
MIPSISSFFFKRSSTETGLKAVSTEGSARTRLEGIESVEEEGGGGGGGGGGGLVCSAEV